MKIIDFMETIEPLSLENISISWNIYHNFENPPDETKFEGNYNIEVFPAESKECEENASAINEIRNPFPDLKFVNKDQNYSVTIPSHRLLTVSLEEEKVVFTFMPHGIKPIEGFPTEKHISWGRCSINGDTDKKSKILKNLIQILFINQKTPRSRCETCKGLKMLIGDSDSDFDSELYDHQLICYDCLQGSISFFKELTVQIEEFEKENNINQSRQTLFQLIDGGIELADRLNNEKLHSEFLYFQALLISKDEDPKAVHESLDLLERIIMFSSSWNYNKLREKSEKLKSTILENNPIIQSIEEEVSPENQEAIKKIDNPVQIGIKFLQKAKAFEQQGKYQEAVYCIKRASRPLVDNGVWTDEDYRMGQQEISRLRNLMKNVKPEPVEEVVPEPVEEVVPEPVEEVVPEPVEEVVPEPVEEVVPEPVEEEVPEPVEEVVPESVEEVVPESVAEVEPESVAEVEPESVAEVEPESVAEVEPESVQVPLKPVEEVVSEPVEEVVPEPVEEVVPEPVEEVVPEPVEEDPIIESIEEIMKKIKKTNILNLTIKPVQPSKPIKVVDNSIQDEEIVESKKNSTIFPVETAEEKSEDEIKNIIEQQSSTDKKFSFEPTILSEDSPVSIKDQNSDEIIKTKELSEEKIEIDPSLEEEKIEITPKRSIRGYNLFGVPNNLSKNGTPSIKLQDSEKKPSLKDTPVIQKSSNLKRRLRRRTSGKKTKSKIEICPMCAKLKCVCGYMDKVKK